MYDALQDQEGWLDSDIVMLGIQLLCNDSYSQLFSQNKIKVINVGFTNLNKEMLEEFYETDENFNKI